MSELFFYATARHPGVIHALRAQVQRLLSPLHDLVAQSAHDLQTRMAHDLLSQSARSQDAIPAVSHEIPAASHEIPAASHEIPAASHEIPAASHEEALSALHAQRRALWQLSHAPAPHHQGLLRLCEHAKHVRWPRLSVDERAPEPTWRLLRDPAQPSTAPQRAFVRAALCTPDFALLNAPPGTAQTQALCELILQSLDRGERVLLCAVSPATLSRLLSALLKAHPSLPAVYLGDPAELPSDLRGLHIEQQVQRALDTARAQPALAHRAEADRHRIVEALTLRAAGLTAGTITGILRHPALRTQRPADTPQPIALQPHWDMLVLDEAQQILWPSFLPPALAAERWILSGQRPRGATAAALSHQISAFFRQMTLGDPPLFPLAHQRACHLLHCLLSEPASTAGLRWLIAESAQVLDWIERELRERPDPGRSIVRLSERAPRRRRRGQFEDITARQLRTDKEAALRAAAADWLLIDEAILSACAEDLPWNLLLTRALQGPLAANHPFLMRQSRWLYVAKHPQEHLKRAAHDPPQAHRLTTLQAHTIQRLSQRDLALEFVLCVDELEARGASAQALEAPPTIQQIFGRLLPAAGQKDLPIAQIGGWAQRSIFELLHGGVGAHGAYYQSVLARGVQQTHPKVFAARSFTLPQPTAAGAPEMESVSAERPRGGP